MVFSQVCFFSKMNIPEKDQVRVCHAIVDGGNHIRYMKQQLFSSLKRVDISSSKNKVEKDWTKCDSILLTGYDKHELKEVYKYLTKYAWDTIGITPKMSVPVPEHTLDFVMSQIGRIEKLAGDFCSIYFNDKTGLVDIFFITQKSGDRAKIYIGGKIKEFMTKNKTVKKEVTVSQNRFAGFELTEEEPTEEPTKEPTEELTKEPTKKPTKKKLTKEEKKALEMEFKRMITSNHQPGMSERERWTIREELSKKCNTFGEPLYPSYRNKHTGRKFEGVHAVPWDEVDRHILKMEKNRFSSSTEADKLCSKVQRGRVQRTQHKKLIEPKAFPSTLGSKQTSSNSVWGSTPSAIRCSKGVEELNETCRRDNYFSKITRKARPDVKEPEIVLGGEFEDDFAMTNQFDDEENTWGTEISGSWWDA